MSQEGTHYDLPKPRTSFPVGHLTTGIAYAFPWHRDVRYALRRNRSIGGCPCFPSVMTTPCASISRASTER